MSEENTNASEVVQAEGEENTVEETEINNENAHEEDTGVNAEEEASGENEITQEHIPEFENFINTGLNEAVACSIEELCKSGVIAATDLDNRALEALKEFPVEDALEVLKELSGTSLNHVSNKSAYLCGMMKTYRQRKSTQSLSASDSSKKVGPDEAKLKAILEKSGYSMEVTTGQRKYGGPPPNWEGPPPGAGHEIFIGKLPRDVYEDDLIPLLESSGQLYDMRIMMDSTTGFNRGYAFAMFVDKEAAKQAVQKLDAYEIRPGKKLKANVSVANVRLFVGNIPKSKSRDEILEMFKTLTENLMDVIVYSTPDDPKKKNRGFAFLEFATHKDASTARRKLGSGHSRVWNCDIIVDWAEPQDEPDEKTMQSVKVVYVRNLKNEVTEDELKQLFEPYGAIERVRKVRDYGFVHFEERDHALKAIEELNGRELHGMPITAQLAKPPSDHKKDKRQPSLGGGNSGASYLDDYWPPVPAPLLRPLPLGLPRRVPRPPPGAAARLAAMAAYDYDYDMYDYGGGFADDYYGGYDEPSYYDDYYGNYPLPPPRPRGRGVIPPLTSIRARGIGGMRPNPRGMMQNRSRGPSGRGGSGGGGATNRNRGRAAASRGSGGARGGGGGGAKRKAFGGDQQQASKKRNTNGAGTWGTQPIAQQPLQDDQKWYQDTYGSNSWS